MANVLFLLIFFLLSFCGYSQKKDITRIYNYQTGINSFKLIVKNDSEFSFVLRLASDTLKGKLINDAGNFSFFIDTFKIDRFKKNLYINLKKSIRLIKDQTANAPLLNISFDTTHWFFLDTSGLSSALKGNYLTSTGFVGCTVEVRENRTITFEPFNDVGARESKETSHWIKHGSTIKLKKHSYLASWFTDNSTFFLLPFMIIGKTIKEDNNSLVETYNYFIKYSLVE